MRRFRVVRGALLRFRAQNGAEAVCGGAPKACYVQFCNCFYIGMPCFKANDVALDRRFALILSKFFLKNEAERSDKDLYSSVSVTLFNM